MPKIWEKFERVILIGGRVDSGFDSCLIDTGSNPAEAGHCIAALGWLFTPAVPSGTEGWLNQLTPLL